MITKDEKLSYKMYDILKSIIRPDNANEDQVKEAQRACQWLTENIHELRKVCNPAEMRLLTMVYDHFEINHMAPALAVLDRLAIEMKDANAQDNLEEYKCMESDRSPFPAEDLPWLLSLRATQFADERIEKLGLTIALIASSGGHPKKDGGRVQGAKPAVEYFLRQLDNVVPGQRPNYNRVDASDQLSVERQLRRILEPEQGDLITTGLRTLDEQVAIRKGWLIGILAMAGQGKSTLSRTILYNAALTGSSVCMIPLEMAPEQETLAFSVIHACTCFPDECQTLGISQDRAAKGRLSAKAVTFLMEDVVQNMNATFDGLDGRGYLRISRPGDNSLDSVLGTVAAEEARHPLDVVCIDHLRCISIDGKNPRAEVEAVVTRLREKATYHADGKGLTIISPLQSNREGWAKAGQNGGVWDLSGIMEYSSFGQYADLVIGVYRDDKLDQLNQVTVSNPKFRHGPQLRPFQLYASPASRLLIDGHVEEESLDGMLDQL